MQAVVVHVVEDGRTDGHIGYKAEVDRHITVCIGQVVLCTTLKSFLGIIRFCAGIEINQGRCDEGSGASRLSAVIYAVEVIRNVLTKGGLQRRLVWIGDDDLVIAGSQVAEIIVAIGVSRNRGDGVLFDPFDQSVAIGIEEQLDLDAGDAVFSRTARILKAVIVRIVEYGGADAHSGGQAEVDGHIAVIVGAGQVIVLFATGIIGIGAFERFLAGGKHDHRRNDDGADTVRLIAVVVVVHLVVIGVGGGAGDRIIFRSGAGAEIGGGYRYYVASGKEPAEQVFAPVHGGGRSGRHVI